MKQVAVLVMLMLAGVLAHGQTAVGAKLGKAVVSCEKRHWPYSDPTCDAYALEMAHEYFQEHPEFFEPAPPVAPVTTPEWSLSSGITATCPDGLTCDSKTGKPIPLQCGKLQHEEYTPPHCANTCDPYGTTCYANCLGVRGSDKCVDDTHPLTEREWQDLQTKLKELQPKK